MGFQVGSACYETAQQANAATASTQAGSNLAFGTKVVAVSVEAVSDASITYRYTDASASGAANPSSPGPHPPNCGGSWSNQTFGQPAQACAAYTEFIRGYGWNVESCDVTEFRLVSKLRNIGDTSRTDGETLTRDNCTPDTGGGSAAVSYTVVVPSTPPPCGLLDWADGLDLGWQVAAAWIACAVVLHLRNSIGTQV